LRIDERFAAFSFIAKPWRTSQVWRLWISQ
jgi:hypothetical protein